MSISITVSSAGAVDIKTNDVVPVEASSDDNTLETKELNTTVESSSEGAVDTKTNDEMSVDAASPQRSPKQNMHDEKPLDLH